MNRANTYKAISFLALFMLLCAPLYAQGNENPGTSVESTQQPAPDAESEANRLNEDVTFSPFGDEITSQMRLRGSFDYRYEYDDNVFSNNAVRLSDNISSFGARFSVATRRKRSNFQLHYAPNFRLYSRFDDRNTFSQSLYNEFGYTFSGRTSLNWSGSLTDRSGGSNSGISFENVGGVVVPVFHGDGQQAQARVLSSNGNLNLTHRFSARSTVKAGVEGGTTNFFEENNVPLLVGRSREQYSIGTHASWTRQVQRGRFFGVSISHRYLWFMSPAAHLNYEQAQLTFEQQFGQGYSLKLGAGPSFSQNSQPGLNLNDTSYAIDVSLARSMRDSQFAIGYTRGTRLGSLQDSVVSDSVVASYSRRFLRRWDAGGNVSYARTKSTSATGLDLDSVGLSTNVRYQLNRSIAFIARFDRTNQFSDTAAFFSSDFDRNSVSVGVSYRFGGE